MKYTWTRGNNEQGKVSNYFIVSSPYGMRISKASSGDNTVYTLWEGNKDRIEDFSSADAAKKYCEEKYG